MCDATYGKLCRILLSLFRLFHYRRKLTSKSPYFCSFNLLTCLLYIAILTIVRRLTPSQVKVINNINIIFMRFLCILMN